MASGSGRDTVLKIDLGGEQILPERIEAVEALSTPFEIALDIIAPLGELDLLPYLGNDATITLLVDGEKQRYFHGYFVEGEFTRESSEGFHYRLSLRPWTHFLSHNAHYAIYQAMTAKKVIQEVLERAGVSDVDYTHLHRDGAEREYCVQYGESDFAFISRLMEEEGIYYYFEHRDGRHVMMLCSRPSSHSFGQPEALTYNPKTLTVFNTDSAARTDSGRKFYLQSWIERVQTGGEKKVVTRDFDFKKPEKPVEATVEVDEADANVPLPQEVFEYPGGYIEESPGKDLNEVTLLSLRADRNTYRGQSQSTGLSCGTKVKVKEHPADRLNGDYLITKTFHGITAERYRSGAGDDEESYNVMFEAVPAKCYWRAPQVTPRPVVQGLETAIVTGPDGEEIYTDEYGRVKVRFPWDRSEAPGEKTTCWIRVSQTGGLGNIIMPRVGHEVLVDFLAGDPDRPVVVGRVFNQSHMPIYALPDNKTRAVWRTKRYGSAGNYPNAKGLDSGAPGANEIRFEDSGGKEELYVHAERDMNTRVRLNETHHVGADQSIDIGHDRNKIVGNDEIATIARDRNAAVGRDQETSISQNDTLNVGTKLKIVVGQEIEIEAGVKITLKVGASKITMDPMSIKIESLAIENKADMTLDLKGTFTTLKGDATLTESGAIVMIN